jgi:hypothetical protein
MFQPISLRTDVKDKYITINTNGLIDILSDLTDKKNYFDNVRKYQKDLWNMVFNLQKIKRKGYSFNYQISTDGYGVSISMINNNDIQKKQDKINKRNKARDKMKSIYQDLDDTEKEKEIHKRKTEYIKRSSELKDKAKKDIKTRQQQIKKLSKDEQEKIKLQEKLKRNEFNYIEDLVKIDSVLKSLKKDYKDNKIGYIDPGKRSPVMILRNDGKIYEYRTKRRLKETRRLKYNELIDHKKRKIKLDDKTIKKLEEKLTEFSRKSLDPKIFKEYTGRKVKFHNMIRNEEFYNDYLKRLKWYLYINTKRHTDKIVNEIKNFLGDDSTLIIGDWSGKGKISYISTPNIGFQRRLREDFNVYHIDEYNTSKIHYSTKKEMSHMRVKTPSGLKKLHAVLTYQKSPREMCHINRDVNAVKNMKIITESLLSTKKRPKEYCRSSSTNLLVGEKMKSVKKVLNKKKSQKYVKVKKML